MKTENKAKVISRKCNYSYCIFWKNDIEFFYQFNFVFFYQFYIDFYKIIEKYGKVDVYYQSLIYTLGISEITRRHFFEIFDIKNGEINIDCINYSWQTNTSSKVVRLAFSLWNSCNYDSMEDCEKNRLSKLYNISEIFSCSFAPFFVEAIKIRYPKYFNASKLNEFIEIEEKNMDSK